MSNNNNNNNNNLHFRSAKIIKNILRHFTKYYLKIFKRLNDKI